MQQDTGPRTWTVRADDQLELVDEIAAFLEDNFGATAHGGSIPTWSADLLRWKLGPANPAGTGFVTVALGDDGLIGVTSLTRKRLLLDGREHAAGEAGDNYINQAYRRSGRCATPHPSTDDPKAYINRSLFGRLVRENTDRAHAHGMTHIYGMPNANALPGYQKRLDYVVLHDVQGRTFPSLRALGRTKGIPTALTAPADAGLSLACRIGSAVSRRVKGMTVTEGVPEAAELDDLWRRVAEGARGPVLIRDAAFIRHRYQQHPLASYRYHALRQGSTLAGLIVSATVTDPLGTEANWIVDVISPRADALDAVLGPVLHGLPPGRHCRLWHGRVDPAPTGLAGLLFRPRAPLPVVWAKSPETEGLLGGRDLHFSAGCGDNV